MTRDAYSKGRWTAHKVFDLIDDGLTMPTKRMGLSTLFNGVDILQSRHYIKMSCRTYIEKMSAKHLQEWMVVFGEQGCTVDGISSVRIGD